jgi:kumamolisin
MEDIMVGRKILADSVSPLPAHTGLAHNGMMVQAAQPIDRKERMPLLFQLQPAADKTADLEARVARGDVLTPHEVNAIYAPTAASAKQLTDWLKTQGFTISHVTNNGAAIYADGDIDTIEKSLAVSMTRVTVDGMTYTAAKDAPSLPDDVGVDVRAIVGLQPFRRAIKHIRKLRRIARRPTGAGADGDAAPNGLLVADILKAYDGDGLPFTGKGQAIAILIDTAPAPSDLQAFWRRNGFIEPFPTVEVINVQGGDLPPREGEETLDAEWASGIAPGADVRIYASGSLSFVDLDRAIDRVIDDFSTLPSMRQVSMSLGLGELYFGSANGEVSTQHQKFLQLAAMGVNVFVSSGDAGSNPGSDGHTADGATQAEYESSDPCVVGVGGTSLFLDASGAVNREVGWASGGGGVSVYFDRPAWQRANGASPGTKRLVPDVSLVADPNTGALVVLDGKEVEYGGTSLSAPIWAGFCALINEARAQKGLPALSFLNPLIYPLGGTPAFRDIIQGSNGAYTAGPGHDLVSGLGVPRLGALIEALTAVAGV